MIFLTFFFFTLTQTQTSILLEFMHALICKHTNNPLYFHSNTHLLRLSFRDFPQKPFPSTSQELCREQCNLHLITRELYCFSQRWSWCSALQGKQPMCILIYWCLNAPLAPMKSLEVSELADVARNPQGNGVRVFPNKHGVLNRGVLDQGRIRQSAWARCKTGFSSIPPACFTNKWNPCPEVCPS